MGGSSAPGAGWTLTPRAVDGATDYLRRVDGRLDAVLADLDGLWHAERAETSMDVLEHDLPHFLAALLSGGKRIRPAMCYWGWTAGGGREDGAGSAHIIEAGAALELLHVFALIHDDVMDESSLRRGQPTVHERAAQLHLRSQAVGSSQRFGDSIAVLVGDLAHSEADHLAGGLPPAMQSVWRQLVVQLVYGQSRDLIGMAAACRDLGHARQVARTKSGGYTVDYPLRLGARAAGATAPAISCLMAYGVALGEAFALRDDLLGVWGDPAVTGKPAGDDLISGKPTVILALAHQRLGGAARAARDRIGGPELSDADVLLLQRELRACGVLDAVEKLIEHNVELAVSALDSDHLDAAGIDGLTELAQRIAWRDL